MVAKGVFCLLAGAAIIASMWFNAMFGFSIGQHTDLIAGAHHGWVYAALFVILDAIKVSVPIMLAAVLLSRIPLLWKGVSLLVGVALFLGATSVSLAGIFGTVAVDRDNFTASRSAEGSNTAALQEERDALREKNVWADTKAPKEVRATLAEFLAEPDNRYDATGGCSPDQITIQKSSEWCQEYNSLVGQVAHAEQVQRDRNRLRELNEKLAEMSGAVEGDPQARRLGDKLGVSPDQFVSDFLTLLALLVEFSGSLFPLMIYVWSRSREPEPETETDPDPEPGNELITLSEARQMIEDAHKKVQSVPEPDCPVQAALERHEGVEEITFPNLSNTVRRICIQRGESPWSAKAIGQRVRELGLPVWQEPTPEGGKVTVYGLLGGAQTEIAEAA